MMQSKLGTLRSQLSSLRRSRAVVRWGSAVCTPVAFALWLLLAGPALSLPSMLVLRSIMGTKKVAVYVALVVVMATVSGLIYGALF